LNDQSKGEKDRFGGSQLCYGYFGRPLKSVHSMSTVESHIFVKTLLGDVTFRQKRIQRRCYEAHQGMESPSYKMRLNRVLLP